MKDSFIFYRSFFEASKPLSDSQRAELFNSICEFALNQSETKKEPIVEAMFTLIKPQLEANNKRYENGKKGGRPKANNKPKDNQTITKAKPNVNVNDNVNDNKLHRGEIFKKLKKYLEKFDNTNDPDKYARWFFGNYTEKNIEKSLNNNMVTSVDKLIKVLDFNKSKNI